MGKCRNTNEDKGLIVISITLMFFLMPKLLIDRSIKIKLEENLLIVFPEYMT